MKLIYILILIVIITYFVISLFAPNVIQSTMVPAKGYTDIQLYIIIGVSTGLIAYMIYSYYKRRAIHRE